jgi:hypothetical protein
MMLRHDLLGEQMPFLANRCLKNRAGLVTIRDDRLAAAPKSCGRLVNIVPGRITIRMELRAPRIRRPVWQVMPV